MWNKNNYSWTKLGLIWGVCMYIVMCVVFPYFTNGIEGKTLIFGLPYWIIIGLFFAWLYQKILPPPPKGE